MKLVYAIDAGIMTLTVIWFYVMFRLFVKVKTHDRT